MKFVDRGSFVLLRTDFPDFQEVSESEADPPLIQILDQETLQEFWWAALTFFSADSVEITGWKPSSERPVEPLVSSLLVLHRLLVEWDRLLPRLVYNKHTEQVLYTQYTTYPVVHRVHSLQSNYRVKNTLVKVHVRSKTTQYQYEQYLLWWMVPFRGKWTC